MSNYSVHTGFWINHESAPVYGATLTVPIRWGNYLISLLTSLVAWSGISAWTLCAYFLHHRYATKDHKDVLDRQLQVLLRGPASAFDVITSAFQLERAWRGESCRSSKRIGPIFLVASTIFLLFAAAGIFVAEVASKSYQDVLVLANPLYCGYLSFGTQGAVDPVTGVLTRENNERRYARNLRKVSRQYATSWYDASALGAKTSSDFSSTTLPFIGSEVPCPFIGGNTTCLGSNRTRDAPAWQVDTGELNSHVHFGMNAPKSERITWRKKTTCAVVDVNPFVGPSSVFPVNHNFNPDNPQIDNVTLQCVFLTSDESCLFGSNPASRYGTNAYDIQGTTTYANPPVQVDSDQWSWEPMFPFNNSKADKVFYLVTPAAAKYFQPIEDPLFFANISGTDEGYVSPFDFSLMTCTDQYEVCNPTNKQCSGLGGVYSLNLDNQPKDINDRLNFNAAQRATAKRFFESTALGGETYPLNDESSPVFLATEGGTYTVLSGIPSNQWQLEVNLFFETSLVGLQNTLLNWIVKPWMTGYDDVPVSSTGMVGPSNAAINATALTSRYVAAGLKEQEQSLCHNQLIRTAAAVQNFSVLATFLVVALTVLIIAAGTFLPAIMSFIRQRRGPKNQGPQKGFTHELMREADQQFQILRMALETAGIYDWKVGPGGIPITAKPFKVTNPVQIDGLPRHSTFRLDSEESGDVEQGIVTVRSTSKDPPEYKETATNSRNSTWKSQSSSGTQNTPSNSP